MTLKLVMLEQARASLAFGLEQFLDDYPGVFLLAVGMVTAHKQPTSTKNEPRQDRATDVVKAVRVTDTLSMGPSERLSHSLRNHPLAGCTFFLATGDTETHTIGRKVGSDLTVPDASVSEVHCDVRLEPTGQLIVTDRGSTNGTYVNLARLAPDFPTPVEDEAVITVGRYSFQYFRAESLFRALEALR